MIKSATVPQSADCRRAFALILPVFLLLSVACEKRAAPHNLHSFFEMKSGGGGGYGAAPATVGVALASVAQSDAIATRKIIRNGSLELLVNNVDQSVDKIGSIVVGVGGFVEKSAQTNSGGHSAAMTVRVPAARLDQVVKEIKALATTVDRESIEVRDVTRDYIDLDARLRNAQAEEAQYLQILKHAASIKDTLDVTEKLSDVRGRIEQLQGEMKFLTAQIDMSTLEITVRAEADASVAGIHWRPLRQAKIALSEMVSGLADWVDSVVAFLINLPLIAAWLLSLVILVFVAARLLRFLWRKFGPKISWRLPWRRSTSRAEPGAQ
jgi:hypothetical protein